MIPNKISIKFPCLGLGCMPFSGCYGQINKIDAQKIIQKASSLGINYFDTADNYGEHANEVLVGKAIKNIKDQVFISSKIGVRKIDNNIVIDGSSSYIKKACEASLKRLNIDQLDLLFYHHLDKKVPIEETIHAMSVLVNQGKVKHIGLFEMDLDTLKKALSIYPISFYQAEYSLLTRGVEKSILPFCAANNINFIANAPLSRGLLTGHADSLNHLKKPDIRNLFPRFQPTFLERNLSLVKKLMIFANDHHMTLPQLSLAWLLKKHVNPIFGTTNLHHLEDNFMALNLSLNDQDLRDLETILSSIEVSGNRLPPFAKDLYLDF